MILVAAKGPRQGFLGGLGRQRFFLRVGDGFGIGYCHYLVGGYNYGSSVLYDNFMIWRP